MTPRGLTPDEINDFLREAFPGGAGAAHVEEADGKRAVCRIRYSESQLRPGGTLVYCTCSLEPEENELMVERPKKKGE